MFIDKTSFKDFNKLSEEEKKMASLITRYAVMDAFNNGIPKGEFLKRNLGSLMLDAELSQEEMQEVINILFVCSFRKTFVKEQGKVGFNLRSANHEDK